MTRLHFTLLLLLPFLSCEVSGENLMVRNEAGQMEQLYDKCPQQGTKCDHIGGTCYHKTQKCNGDVIPDICKGSECYCCLEDDKPIMCRTTTECQKKGVDPGECVDNVQAYIDRQNYYVSELKCEYRECSCVHRCQEELICQKFGGRCFLNEVENCKKGYTMLKGCGCKNVETCGCCVPDALAKEAAAAMGC
ncbi:hypothetical protein Pmani_004159 [Petrolisthes manimaculis]|uniref:Uncharacterized protein n=1 Tax=Petrolisthes manimaculis TaxID=1843537 RepID=A0AAE1QER1_9EUCA|nr:hypothetical protein Pmani_004159 [Petrolisthes manimaculis]